MTRPNLAHPPQSKISLPPLTVNDVEMSMLTSTFEDQVILLMLRQTGSYLFLVTLAQFGRGSVDFLCSSSSSFFLLFFFLSFFFFFSQIPFAIHFGQAARKRGHTLSALSGSRARAFPRTIRPNPIESVKLLAETGVTG